MEITPQSSAYMSAKARAINARIVTMANHNAVYYVDTYTPLATASGVYKTSYTVDGLHLTVLGAEVVARIVYQRVHRMGY